MNISIGGDHCGFELKTMVIKWLEERGHKVIDHGVYDKNPYKYGYKYGNNL